MAEEGAERLSNPEQQEVGCEISPKNVREATPRKYYQYGHLNKTCTSMTPTDTLTRKEETQWYIYYLCFNKQSLPVDWNAKQTH